LGKGGHISETSKSPKNNRLIISATKKKSLFSLETIHLVHGDEKIKNDSKRDGKNVLKSFRKQKKSNDNRNEKWKDKNWYGQYSSSKVSIYPRFSWQKIISFRKSLFPMDLGQIAIQRKTVQKNLFGGFGGGGGGIGFFPVCAWVAICCVSGFFRLRNWSLRRNHSILYFSFSGQYSKMKINKMDESINWFLHLRQKNYKIKFTTTVKRKSPIIIFFFEKDYSRLSI